MQSSLSDAYYEWNSLLRPGWRMMIRQEKLVWSVSCQGFKGKLPRKLRATLALRLWVIEPERHFEARRQ